MVVTGKLALAAWLVSSNIWQQKEYQEGFPKLSQKQGEKGLNLITNCSGISGIAGIIGKKLSISIPFEIFF